jgi:hypothetical protein
MNKLAVNELDTICDEIKALITEGEFNARWTLLETYHEVGRIVSDIQGSTDMSRADLVREVSGRIGKSERTLWYAIKFYEKYPQLNGLPEGKNISWNKVINKYLTAPKNGDIHNGSDEGDCNHEAICVCVKCNKRLENYTPVQQ